MIPASPQPDAPQVIEHRVESSAPSRIKLASGVTVDMSQVQRAPGPDVQVGTGVIRPDGTEITQSKNDKRNARAAASVAHKTRLADFKARQADRRNSLANETPESLMKSSGRSAEFIAAHLNK